MAPGWAEELRSTMSKRIGLYGGSFNPIHIGHLIIARSVGEALDLDRVIFLPSGQPPHKRASDLIDPVHRGEMVRLAVEADSLFEVSDYDLTRDGPCYTFDAVTHFSAEMPDDAKLCWIIGADSLVELATWHRVAELVELCDVVTAARCGWEQPDLSCLRSALSEDQIHRLEQGVLETPRIEISASGIRQRIRDGLSIRHMVPDAVADYIAERGLYRD
jgi:nicotinate-nucleotide adenylyltransferase